MNRLTENKLITEFKKPIWGIALTLLLSFLVLITFWGHAIKNLNSTYFATGGDGLKDYYNSVYFVKYDNSYWHSNAMNYPYGEHVAFTGNQLVISHAIKFISNNIVDISDYTVGIINMCMLASLLLGSLFLFLLLKHFKLPTLYSIIVAIGITFLSPQIARMTGHFSLSYTFAIPLILYLMVKFHEKPRWQISALLALFMLWSFGTHMYMMGFYAFIVLIYWVFIILVIKNINLKNGLLHFAIQFLLPFLTILIIVGITDHITDRTAEPWGFLVYVANFRSVFLPLGRPYAKALNQFPSIVNTEWEGIAFIGITTLIGTLILFRNFLKQFFSKDALNALWPKSNPPIFNVFIWVSIASLLYSFGYPFKLGLHFLVDFIGPLKQMRGIARFSWIFFYVINIYIFIKLWEIKTLPNWLKSSVIIIALSALLYDAHYNTEYWSNSLRRNPSSHLTKQINDRGNNQWLELIEIEKFQAVLPLPYFHIGSENIWLDGKDGIAETSYLVSWLTGLPNMGVMLSRTSISQTFSSLQLIWEPYERPELMSRLVPDKDILIVSTGNNSQLTLAQQELINNSSLMYGDDNLSLYTLTVDVLAQLFDNTYAKQLIDYNSEMLFEHGSYKCSNAEKNFFVDTLGNNTNQLWKYDGGYLTKELWPIRRFYEFKTPSSGTDVEYLLSFWVHGIKKDKLPRSQLIVEISDNNGDNYYYDASSLFRSLKAVDGNWGLIEIPFTAKSQNDHVVFLLNNFDLRKDNYTVSHILVREKNTDVYKLTDKWLMKNNRFYSE